MLKDKLRILREQHELSQAKLAEVLGVSPAAYSTYEMGTRDVSSDKVVKLAKYYGVTTDYLYDIEKTEEEFNSFERTMIKKYRTLDEYGKRMVDSALEIEYERCMDYGDSIKVYRAAQSDNHHEDEITEMSVERLQKLKDAPKSNKNL